MSGKRGKLEPWWEQAEEDDLKTLLKKELTRAAEKQGAMYSDEGKIQVYVVASAIHDQLNAVCKELGKVVRDFYKEMRKTGLMREKCMIMPMREFMLWHKAFLAERFEDIYKSKKTKNLCADFMSTVTLEVMRYFELLLDEVLAEKEVEGSENANNGI